MRIHKKEKTISLAMDNLTYCRMHADALAIEAELADNQPLSVDGEKTGAKGWINRFVTEVKNGLRRQVSNDLTADKKQAADALTAFERVHAPAELSLSHSPEKLRTYMDKQIFKRDAYGLKKAQFALAFLIADEHVYLRPAESLAAVSEMLFDDMTYMDTLYEDFLANYRSLYKATVLEEVGCALFGTKAVKAFFSFARGHARVELNALSLNEVHTTLAMELTLIQSIKGAMPEDKLKDFMDKFLKHVGDLRADAEYQWLVEKLDVPACKEKIARYDRCIARLGEIFGV